MVSSVSTQEEEKGIQVDMPFFQAPPTLPHAFDTDALLQKILAMKLPADLRKEVEPNLRELGAWASGPGYEGYLANRSNEPVLKQWGPWGNRIDEIELPAHWTVSRDVAFRYGLVASAYEKKYGAYARIIQTALIYLFEPSSGVFSCPLAMTDGAAKALLASGNKELIDRALPNLLSRDPKTGWTSGQWMTERTGGSDVGISETIAKAVPGASLEGLSQSCFELHGTKWFTSATTSEMALTLARPEGNAPGGSGLALFYVETRDKNGVLNGIRINRLKEKLGTKMVPTAELSLEGTLAVPVAGTKDGTKNVAPMLAITRLWNTTCAAAGMRRAVSLAKSYATKRVAFGAPLSEKPVHLATFAQCAAETAGATLFTFRIAELLGKEEHNAATDSEKELTRLLVPVAKLTTGKQAVAVASEVLEMFGGAGYVEDTGLPRLLRDAQVLPIWEGTTNVLSLDVFRAMGRNGSLDSFTAEIEARLAHVPAALRKEAVIARKASEAAVAWLEASRAAGMDTLESGARAFALTLGRTLELALLLDLAASDATFEAHAKVFGGTTINFLSPLSTLEETRAVFACT